MKADTGQKFIVRADFYGDILPNQKKSFWFPLNKGILYFSETKIHYRIFASDLDYLELEFERIIKIKMQTLNPRKHQWTDWLLGNPYYFLFWNPFWNKYLLNLTYLDRQGHPRDVFFKLKTKRITRETLSILKKLL